MGLTSFVHQAKSLIGTAINGVLFDEKSKGWKIDAASIPMPAGKNEGRSVAEVLSDLPETAGITQASGTIVLNDDPQWGAMTYGLVKTGKVITLTFRVVPAYEQNNSVNMIGTLPEHYRPLVNVECLVRESRNAAGETVVSSIVLNSNGQLTAVGLMQEEYAFSIFYVIS